MTVLRVDRLRIEITGSRTTRPVRGVSLEVAAGETVGIVGETGSGKTLTGLAVLGLLPAGARADGTVELAGQSILTSSGRQLRRLRGGTAAMIFQNPGTAFDPVRTLAVQFRRVIGRHRDVGGAEADRIARRMLAEVELSDPGRVLAAYPHQLSGGMLQRAMIALALCCRPRLLIADEPTSALDVTVAAGVRRLLLTLQAQHGFGMLFITHNLGEAYDVCDRLVVLYAGQVAEAGPTERVFTHPAHPYTRALLAALPTVDAVGRPLTALPGTVPANGLTPAGCVFANRCAEATSHCRDTEPAAVDLGAGHSAACHYATTEVVA